MTAGREREASREPPRTPNGAAERVGCNPRRAGFQSLCRNATSSSGHGLFTLSVAEGQPCRYKSKINAASAAEGRKFEFPHRLFNPRLRPKPCPLSPCFSAPRPPVLIDTLAIRK